MSLATGRYQLASALKTLHVRWDETCMSWRDDVRREFTERFWNTLEYATCGGCFSLELLNKCLSQCHRQLLGAHNHAARG